MSATSIARRPRRGRTFWARMVAEQNDSGVSAPVFCAKHDLGVRTFTRWKRKLERAAPSPAFVELPSGSSTAEPSPPRGWEVELELAEGVHLRVRRL